MKAEQIMIRSIGALVGSSAVVLGAWLTQGKPLHTMELKLELPPQAQAHSVPAAEVTAIELTAKPKSVVVEPDAMPAQEEIQVLVASASEELPPPLPAEEGGDPVIQGPLGPEPVSTENGDASLQPKFARAKGLTQDEPTTQWQAIWEPFNSLTSAEGFGNRLSQVTGLVLDTREQSPGKYLVVMAYASDAERLACLAAISAKTGIDLQGVEQ